MKLMGSTTSPFVRRIRLWLDQTPYDFLNLDIFSETGREVLRSSNPTRKIPMLIDDAQSVFDSRIIHRYLNQKLNREPPLSWDRENLLTLIDAANDSYVELLLTGRSGVDVSADTLFFNLQRERIQSTLEALEQAAQDGQFSDWDFASICLYCLLDWCQFRKLESFEAFPALQQFKAAQANRPIVIATDPRQSLS